MTTEGCRSAAASAARQAARDAAHDAKVVANDAMNAAKGMFKAAKGIMGGFVREMKSTKGNNSNNNASKTQAADPFS